MPIYDYKCISCGFEDEYIKSISVPKELQPPTNCPKCGSKMEQLLSFGKDIGLDFRGTGFYTNDYKKNWKRNFTPAQQASILLGEKDPW